MVQAAGGVRAAVGCRQACRSGQVVTSQQWIEAGIRRQRPAALRGIRQARARIGAAIRIQAHRIRGWIHNSESILFRQDRVCVGNSRLHVVDALDVRYGRVQAEVGQRAVLADGLELQIGLQVGERIIARIVVVLILPHKAPEREYRVRVHQPRPGGRHVERPDLGPLIRGAYGHAVRAQPVVVHHQSRPRGGVLRVVRIGRLEPGSREFQIHVDRIRLGRLEIHAVEEVLFIAPIMHDAEFRSIQEPARVQAAD